MNLINVIANRNSSKAKPGHKKKTPKTNVHKAKLFLQNTVNYALVKD